MTTDAATTISPSTPAVPDSSPASGPAPSPARAPAGLHSAAGRVAAARRAGPQPPPPTDAVGVALRRLTEALRVSTAEVAHLLARPTPSAHRRSASPVQVVRASPA